MFAASPPLGSKLCVLDTARLRLRPYEASDAAAFFRVLDESRDRLRLSFPDRLRSVPTLAEAPGQLATFAHDWRTGRFYVFGIWHQQTQAYLGDICLMPQRGGQAEIGYYLAAEAEGHGYAREALGAIIRFGFEQIGATHLLIRCFVDNVRAQQVARAHGFRLLGEEPASESRSWFRFNLWDTSPPLPAILHFTLARC
ncbi:GNAT family N-acetyltransferase [Hymenobacter setariae]|uniref:GNAT family N-acetyltransferase n=1 Tax=Hymenobacter setariae TaxID=2594794 RepID=A0A558BYZ9_9BACT|nr:GNAT family N-acetyltransferase [Hymenobacter setariae]TVT41738.1 GNAT family N-acetyltransferase [Hymenobacter setariae]